MTGRQDSLPTFLLTFLATLAAVLVQAFLAIGWKVIGSPDFGDEVTAAWFMLWTLACAFLPCLAASGFAAFVARPVSRTRAGWALLATAWALLATAWALAWLVPSFLVAEAHSDTFGATWTPQEVLLELVLEAPWGLPCLLAGGFLLHRLLRAGPRPGGPPALQGNPWNNYPWNEAFRPGPSPLESPCP